MAHKEKGKIYVGRKSFQTAFGGNVAIARVRCFRTFFWVSWLIFVQTSKSRQSNLIRKRMGLWKAFNTNLNLTFFRNVPCYFIILVLFLQCGRWGKNSSPSMSSSTVS